MGAKWDGLSACDLIRWAIHRNLDPAEVVLRAGLSVSGATIKVQSAAARRGKDIPILSEAQERRLLNGTAPIAAEGASRPLPPRKIAVARAGGGSGLWVISTGQSGAAAAALYAAEAAGLRTGGHMPRGFRRDGKDDGPDFAQRFGLQEVRGRENYDAIVACLKGADAVVRVAGKNAEFFQSIPTWEVVKEFTRQVFDLNCDGPQPPDRLGRWLRQFGRVAFFGNSESFDPGIFKWSKAYFTQAFACRERSRLKEE